MDDMFISHSYSHFDVAILGVTRVGKSHLLNSLSQPSNIRYYKAKYAFGLYPQFAEHDFWKKWNNLIGKKQVPEDLEQIFKLLYPNHQILLPEEHNDLLHILLQGLEQASSNIDLDIHTRLQKLLFNNGLSEQVSLIMDILSKYNGPSPVSLNCKFQLILNQLNLFNIAPLDRTLSGQMKKNFALTVLGSFLRKSISNYLSKIKHFIAILKSLLSHTIQLLYIAKKIHDKISDSPTTQKKEPPIGGIKVGGKQHGNHSHVAEILYPTQLLKLAA